MWRHLNGRDDANFFLQVSAQQFETFVKLERELQRLEVAIQLYNRIADKFDRSDFQASSWRRVLPCPPMFQPLLMCVHHAQNFEGAFSVCHAACWTSTISLHDARDLNPEPKVPHAMAICHRMNDGGVLQRACRMITGQKLDPELIDIIFHLFDVNRDGSLASKEFIQVPLQLLECNHGMLI